MSRYHSKMAQDRFFEHHRSFKVYLSTEDDMEIIRAIMQSKCTSRYIRDALKYYASNCPVGKSKV